MRLAVSILLAIAAGMARWSDPAHAATPARAATTPTTPTTATPASAAKKPNVIFILVDDQGYYDLGCYGGDEFHTPRIDRMAREGVRLTDYYAAAPICSPSRVGVLTGCYPRRVGLATWVHRADSKLGIHPDELTLPELFKANGYATACIGKWHLGFKPPFLPRRQGFDHYFGLLHNLDPVEVVYFKDKGGVPLIRNGEVVKRPADPAELTRLYTDEAITFIGKQKDKPFFLYLPHTMLHNPLGASEPFKGKSKMGLYGDAVAEMDHHVGRLFDALKKQGIDDNTVVVYASDNGRGPGRKPSQPLQGRKLSTWEAGIRVPGIVWGPGVGIRAKHESSQVIRAMDWYPTLATLAGIEVPKGRVIDGRDITPLLSGKSDVVPPASENTALNGKVPLRRKWEPAGEWKDIVTREEYERAFFYFGSHGALAAVRLDEWKMTLHPTLTLYNLKQDPGETKRARGKILRKLRGMVVMFQEEMLLNARPPGRYVESDAQTLRRPANQSGRTAVPPAVRQRLVATKEVTYVRYGDRTLAMDIYRPKQAREPLPAVVCIHGGGWAKGNRTSHANLAMALADRGFVAATISYRLSGEAPFPAQIHDCKAAVRFLRVNAKAYGIDSKRIGAIGLSAGGHLTALLATSGGADVLEGAARNREGESSNREAAASTIQAAVAMGAQTDLESARVAGVSADEKRGGIWRQFLGGTQSQKPKVYQIASPLHYLDASDPPLALVAGEHDDASTRGDALRARAKKLGVPTPLKIIADAPHGFLNKQAWFDAAVDYAAAFFTVHLKATK